jgi:tetratricopeptide (TPR) repeat protein
MARRPDQHAALYEDSTPTRVGTPLYCHQEFLEKMEENRANTVGRRAALLLQRLLVDVRRQYYKPTQGENRGWRRSPLGGNHGSHFYAWWAPRGAAPLKVNPEFESAPEGAVFLRDIRHHDDHTPLNPQSVAEHYLPIGVKELRQEDYVPPPWTPAQAKFAEARQKIRIIKGFPGSGKTTALWHAADMAGRKSILYITYSPELAALARDHFDKFAPSHKQFHVVTYAEFLREVTGSNAPFEPVRHVRQAFVKEVSGFSPTILGPWSSEKAALYDEMHAHLFGALLPFSVGRFAGYPERRITARQYRDLRERSIGRVAAEAVVEVCETLRRRDSRSVEGRFFQELDLAWNAVERIRSQGPGRFAGFDCMALDEAQDLTPIEALAIVELAAAVTSATAGLNLLVAGDEAQTVRPTDFEWGWFQDLLHYRLASPVEFRLQTNLRSPRRIATLVNRVWDLYGAIAKSERPGGIGAAEIDDNAGDQVILCAAKPGPELDELLEVFSEREGLALIAMGEEVPSYVPERLRDRVLTTFEAKGLDFQSVCILDAGKWLDRVLQARDRGRGLELEDLSKRLAIDQLRVALSRPAERLYWLDVDPNERILGYSENMLSAGAERAYPMVPAVLLKTLEEEALEAEERVRLCESDAHQFLAIRPALAWSRARQAVALLGEPGGKFSVADPEARNSAQLTLCQVAFTLAFRKVNLPSEMGRVDLFGEGAQSADRAARPRFAALLRAIGDHERDYSGEKTASLLRLGSGLAHYHEEVAPWLLVELQPRSAAWLQAMEEQVAMFPDMVLEMMPSLYRLFAPMEAERRTAQVREKAIRALMRMNGYAGALRILQQAPGADPKLIAECREGLGELDLAAVEYLKAGSSQDALRCYRLIPDFDRSLELLDAVGKHPARDSLLWLRRMRDLASERPAEFQKVILPAEKKLLEEVLQTALGVSRKKPAAKRTKAAVKKAASPRKKKEEYF